MVDVISHLQSAGFSDQEIQTWSADQRQTLLSAGFTDAEVDDYFGMPKTPTETPRPFFDRFMRGNAVGRILKRAVEGSAEGYGEEPPVDQKQFEFLQKIGVFPEGKAEPLFWQKSIYTALASINTIGRIPNAAMGAIAGTIGGATQELGGSSGTSQSAERDAYQLMMVGGLLASTSPNYRIKAGPAGRVDVQSIPQELPHGQDFLDASRSIGNGDAMPHVETKLGTIYEEKGLHPAEVAHDAQSDPTIAQSMLSSDRDDMPEAYGPMRPKVTLEKSFSMEGIDHYQIISEDDKILANISVKVTDSAANVENIYAGTTNPAIFGEEEATPNVLGSSVLREALRQFREQNPDIQKLTGERISGARFGGEYRKGKGVEVEIPIEPQEDVLTEKQPSSAGAAAVEPPPYSDAEKQILSKISIDEKAPEAKLTWGKLYTNFLDKLYPIGKAVKEADLPDLKADENPYTLARLLSGSAGKADHFLNRGTFDFRTYENNGPGLRDILNPVRDDLNGFRAYAAAARALELEGRGIKSGFAEEASAPPLVSTGLDAARTVVVEGREKYEKPFRELIAYQNRVSQYLRDSGVLSDAGYAAMLEGNKMYVPFYRVMGLDEGAAAAGGSSLQARNPIKEIKGSARAIIDPIESIVRNTYHFVEMAERNQVGTKLVDMLLRSSEEASPEAIAAVVKHISEGSAEEAAISDALKEVGLKDVNDLAISLFEGRKTTGDGEISVLRDGKRTVYQVDRDLARAMKGLDAQAMGMLEKILSFPASTLRAGAVTTPDFALRHTIRDFLYAATTFKGGAFSPMDMAKGFSGLIMKDEDFWNWMKGGGGSVSMVSLDRQYLQENLRELTGQTGLVGRAWNVLTDPEASMWDKTASVGKLPFQAISKFVLDPLRVATEFAESASHLGAFKKTLRASERAEPEAANLRQQIIQAAWASRDTAVDASRMGANMRAYNMITAFANIKLQDTDRVVRAIRDNPVSTLTKIGAAITVPSVVLWAANHDDPRYAEIPQWQKDMFWLVMTPDHVFRIPKPWAMGMVFGSLPERLLDSYVGENPDAFKGYFKSLWAASGPDFVPTAAAPIIDQFANRSTFTNRTLIPADQEKFLPEYQYTPYTTELTKALGRIVGAFPGMTQIKMDNSGWGGTARALTSPILMENYVRGWSGNLGVYALNAADAALRKTGVLPDPPQPAATLADIPVVKAFVIRYPSATTESIQSFYDAYEANKKYFDTWMAKARDGDVAAMEHIQEMGGPLMFAQLDSIKQTMSEHSQIIRDIYKNPEIPPDEKRQLIDQLYFSEIQIARYGNETLQALRLKVPSPDYDHEAHVDWRGNRVGR